MIQIVHNFRQNVVLIINHLVAIICIICVQLKMSVQYCNDTLLKKAGFPTMMKSNTSTNPRS